MLGKQTEFTLICMFSFRDGSLDYRSNLFAGLCGSTAFFLIISALAFPNGPFVRPHPILWRMVFGLSVIYLLAIQFLIHQVGLRRERDYGICGDHGKLCG